METTMNKPLTNEELDNLGLWHGRGARLRERAIAEIRDLLTKNAKLTTENGTVERARRLQAADTKRLEADNAKLESEVRDLLDSRAKIVCGMYDAEDEFKVENANLREYTEHTHDCNMVTGYDGGNCTCGLDDLLKVFE